MNKNTMLDDDYKPVTKEENDTVGNTKNINNEEIREVFPCDINQSEIDSAWDQNSTRCLISCWSKLMKQINNFSEKTKNTFWQLVSNHMVEQGFYFDAVSCEVQWINLKKRYNTYNKLLLENINKTEASIVWSHYYEMDRAVNIIPLATIDADNELDDGLKYNNCNTTVSHSNINPSVTISWSMGSTFCLIYAVDHHKEKFKKAAAGEKCLIWKQISEELAQKNFHFSPRACDYKWRTLKKHNNKSRKRFNRNKTVAWVYYKTIDRVLRASKKEKSPRNDEASSSYVNNQSDEDVELDEHNYATTSKANDSIKKEDIFELAEMIRLRDIELDQRLKKIQNALKRNKKVFQDMKRQTLDSLKILNNLQVCTLNLLEKLSSKFNVPI